MENVDQVEDMLKAAAVWVTITITMQRVQESTSFCGVKYSDGSVYCDTKSGGGGWTVIQRRYNGGVNFTDRDWVEYEDGFGSLCGEFWISLRSMHCLTSQGNWELRIDFELLDGTKSYLHYNIINLQ